jgi:tetratricopeptide (TPR) repeat protein/predicted Ser/Thr protein kinase
MTNAAVETNWSQATRGSGSAVGAELALEVGSLLADRYEILKLLGEGGMGAVYKARDRELDRLVALKVIRPELAGNPSILARFKQELILARKITHRNIIRIYDLGVASGLRFITMEFVEGQDLLSLLEGRKSAPENAVKILRQICSALEAAHAEGVVHRDLKPQNIMVEGSGRVCVMDFGLARSMENTGLTQAGTVMGTPAYMSPEQAKGLPADERADLFSLGIIAYQMLTGRVPYKAESALASMLLRTQGPPPPLTEIEPTVPQALNDIVLKTLATKPEDRYQSASLLNQDLHQWQEGTLAKAIVTPPMVMLAESKAKKWISLSVACAVVLMAGGYGVARWLSAPAAPKSPITVIIADFSNHTGDPVFTGTLESTLKLALEGATFISAYDRVRMRDLGVPPLAALDASKAAEIAANQGLNVVVSGSLDRHGADYEISLQAVQTVTGKRLTTVEETASSKDQVLFAVAKLGTAVRKALGDSTSESAQRLSLETLSANSLEAVHEYAVGLDALSSGKDDQAEAEFSKAVDLDQNFGLAYAGMAIAARNLGRPQDAEKYIKDAITHIDRMTERERFRTRGMLYLLIGDSKKCVDEYDALLTRYPSDTGAYNNLAFCLIDLRNIPQALEATRKAVNILPKRATYHVNLSTYSSFAGDFQTGLKEANATLALNPSYPLAFQALAFANLGLDQLTQAAAAYHDLEKLRAWDSAIGLGDLAVYEGRFGEAVSILQKGAADDTAARRPDSAADKYALLAYAQLSRHQNTPALEAAKNALAISQRVKTRFLAAQVFVAAGETAKAHELATGLGSELQIEPQAYAKLIDGEAALKNKDGREAVRLFTEANGLLDTWIGRFDLGRAYLEMGAFAEADSEFDRCIKRRGEALSLFLDPVPTYGYFPLVYYYQGRVREGMKSAGFAESYRKYVDIRGKAGEDPVVLEVRSRAGQ